MKSRFLLIVLVPTLLLLVVIIWPGMMNTAVARQRTAVSEAEALQALAYGRLIPVAPADPSAPPINRQATAPTTTAPNTASTPSYLAGQIAFSSGRDSLVYNLFRYDVEAGLVTAIFNSQGNDATPVWSPDGTQIVFASDKEGNFDVYRLQVDTGQVTNLTLNNPAQDIHPSWSPDGQQIIFSSNRSGSYYQVYRMDLNGENVQQVGVVPGNNALYPRYSPDGLRVAFMRASIFVVACDWNWDIWTMKADGGDQQRVTSYLAGDFYPNWLPDGSGLIYASCRNFLTSDLYRINLTTQVETRLTNDPWNNEWGGVYSPDGDYIAYNSDASGQADILIQSVNGDIVPSQINSPAEELAPHWFAPSAGFTVRGRVMNFAGRPIAGAAVTNGAGATVYTNEGGVYLFTDLITGTYTISVTSPADYLFRPQSDPTITVPPHTYDLDFWAKDRECLAATAYPPLMLVTGWAGSEGQMLVEDDQLRYFADFEEDHIGHLTPHGYVPGCNLFYAYNTTARLNLEANARIIRDELCRYYDEVHIPGVNWSGTFDLLTFSYGGLRARAYLEDDQLYGQACPDDPTKQIRVGNLFTMGTPHGGEIGNLPFAALIGLGAIVSGNQWPALLEMLPPVRLLANAQSHQPQDGVCYRLLAGDGRMQAATLPTLLLPIYQIWPTVDALPNDFAVHQLSAHALALNAWLYPRTTYILTGDLHGQVPAWLDPLNLLHSFVNPNTSFEAEILPRLGAADCPLLRETNRSAVGLPVIHPPQDIVARLRQPQETVAVPLQEIAAGALNTAQVVTGSFTVTNEGPTVVSLYWFDQDLTLTLTDPQGNNVNSQTPNVDHIFLDTGYGLLSSFQITDTLTGSWTYTITGQALSQETLYRLLVFPAMPVGVRASVPEWRPSGSPVTITATVTYDVATPVVGGIVNAEIHRPDGLLDTLHLYDDGLHHDGAAQDGIFGATYPYTAQGGLYGVRLTAEGIYHDEPYQRSATTLFTVAPDHAALTGDYQDSGVDMDGDGRYEWLELQVGLQVTEASTYTLSAEIYRGTTFVAHASHQLYLAPGTHTIPLHFAGSAIYASQLDGPYKVRQVLLTDRAATTVLVEAADDVHITAPYKYRQFGSIPFLYLPLVQRP